MSCREKDWGVALVLDKQSSSTRKTIISAAQLEVETDYVFSSEWDLELGADGSTGTTEGEKAPAGETRTEPKQCMRKGSQPLCPQGARKRKRAKSARKPIRTRLGFPVGNGLYQRAAKATEQFVKCVSAEADADAEVFLKYHILSNDTTSSLLKRIREEIRSVPTILDAINLKPESPQGTVKPGRQKWRDIELLGKFFENPGVQQIHKDIAFLIVYNTDSTWAEWTQPEVAGIENYMHQWKTTKKHWKRDKALYPDSDYDAFYELVTKGIIMHKDKPLRKPAEKQEQTRPTCRLRSSQKCPQTKLPSIHVTENEDSDFNVDYILNPGA